MMKMDYERHSASRLFESPFLEAASKINPATPFLVYIPVITVLLGYGLYTHATTFGAALVSIPLGWLTWDAMEYALHRFFFHWEGNGPFTRKIHEIIHGYHHRYPDDADRLVMPLGASIPLALVIAALLYPLHAPRFTLPFFCGLVAGYLLYDYLHWAVHAKAPSTKWGKTMRAHHMAHHFAAPDKNFGISHRWVDVLIGTMCRRDPRVDP